MDWIGEVMDRVSAVWRGLFPEGQVFWKSGTFWLAAAAVILPFGWLLFAVKLRPVRVRATYARRRR